MRLSPGIFIYIKALADKASVLDKRCGHFICPCFMFYLIGQSETEVSSVRSDVVSGTNAGQGH